MLDYGIFEPFTNTCTLQNFAEVDIPEQKPEPDPLAEGED